jgi:hypothetical protein
VAAILIDAVQQRALPLRQRSRARGLLRPEPVISRHRGGSTSASIVTCRCSTRSSLRSGPLMPRTTA